MNCQKLNFSPLFLILVGLILFSETFGQEKYFTVTDPIPNKFIVVLDKSKYNDENKESVAPVAQGLAASHNGQLGFIYDSAIYGFSVEMNEEDAIAMSYDPEVEYVIQDNPMFMTDTQFNAPWNLDRIDQRDLPLNTTYSYTYVGLGVTAYIIDSGITQFHPEFINPNNGLPRATIGADFVGGNGIDCNGHGTHVAAIAGGTTYGVAKWLAPIVAVRVFGCSGNSSTSTVIAGVNWVRANHVARSVVNMSLGGSANVALDDAVRNLISSGVTCVIAAGNDNTDANNTSPARVRQAITVGASDINDNRASFSNYGTALDVFAPGVSVTSAWLNGTYNTISGTSMAAPHVTGVVAQILNTSVSVIPPTDVQEVVVANASWQRVNNKGAGSPSTLLFNGSFNYSNGNGFSLYTDIGEAGPLRTTFTIIVGMKSALAHPVIQLTVSRGMCFRFSRLGQFHCTGTGACRRQTIYTPRISTSSVTVISDISWKVW